MINGIGNFGSLDPSNSSDLHQDPLQKILPKIEKTHELHSQDKEKLRHPFPTPAKENKNALPPFLSPSPLELAHSYQTIEGKISAPERPTSMIPSNPAPEGFERLADKIIETPPEFPPPSIDEPVARPPSHLKNELPQSDSFWQDFDMPDDPPPRRNFEERSEPSLAPMKRKRQAGEHTPLAKKETKLNSQQELLASVSPPPKKGTDEEAAARALRPSSREEKPKQQLERQSPAPKEKKGPASKIEQKSEADKEREEKPLILPDPLPAQFGFIAQNAQVAAASYLNPVTEVLFQQLVKAIIFVQATTPGVSRTEIVLRGAELNQSPFNNTTVVIEQHKTAPGSLNIYLQGSPQAVQIFDQNLSNLKMAFQVAYDNREIDFRVVRLETALSSRWSSHRDKEEESDEGSEE